ncbi:B12-binding domain-containing radical SAM protein [bacterium]|nr:B12-binding domain-containing radical SAM protein [bacterium]
MAKVAFVQNFWFEFLGPMYLSSYLKAHGHQVELFMSDRIDTCVSEVEAFDPNIIAFSCSSGSHQFASHFAAAFKARRSVYAVMGGPHATFYPAAVKQDQIDLLVRGEGEEAILELVEALEQGRDYRQIRNLVYREGEQIVQNPVRPLIEDLDSLPSPDRGLYYKYKYLRNNPNKHFITGRGCPYQCTFCCNKSYKTLYHGLGKMVRRHSVERAIGDIVALHRDYGFSALRFDDEVFILSPDWLSTFLECYTEQVHIPFSCLIRADLLKEDMARLLKRAGCYIAYFGIESGNEHLRNEILKKRVTRADIVTTAKLLEQFGIKSGTFNMLGIPGETVEMAFETVKLNQEIRADYPWCSIVQPYPDTELEKIALDMGCLHQAGSIDTFSSSYFNKSVIDNPFSEQLENLHKFFYVLVKFPLLEPFIRRLIKMRSNILFDFIFQITYAYRYIKTYRISWIRLATYALKMKSHF